MPGQPQARSQTSLWPRQIATHTLLGIRRPSPGHLNLSFPDLPPEAFKCRRKRGNSSRPTALAGDHARLPHRDRNKGQRYPADPPTVDEIVALWRAGLRIYEALALNETHLSGRFVVRRGGLEPPTLGLRVIRVDRGRDGPSPLGLGPPPAQIPACTASALGSSLGFWRRIASRVGGASRGRVVAIGSRVGSCVPSPGLSAGCGAGARGTSAWLPGCETR